VLSFFRRTRVRLTFVNTVLVFAVGGVASAAFWTTDVQYEYSTIDETLRSQADVVRSIIAETPPTARLPVLPPGNPRGVAMDTIVVDSRGTIVGQDSSDLDTAAIVAWGVRQGFPAHAGLHSVPLDGVTLRVLLRVVTLPDQSQGGLIIARPIDELIARLGRTALALVIGVCGLVGIGGLLAWRLAGLALAPVRHMSSAAREMSEHDLHRRLKSELPSDDELGELAITFNGMLYRLESAFNTLQRFTADAAHELRVPLAVMRSQVEVTLRQPRSVEEYKQSHLALLQEIKRLGRIADHLLMLARVDAGALGRSVHEFDLPDLLEEMVSRWAPIAKERGVKVLSEIPSEGRIEADGDLISRVLDNLLDNAVGHAPPGGEVRLDASCQNGDWKIVVSDSGPGIPTGMRHQVFERFFRSDTARGRSNGGAGLGLSLSKAVAELHGGSIEVADKGPLKGACFVLRLPVKAAGPSLVKC
jgi:heavy metal sensor kinase